jgi:DNA-binding NarL/FixJ family response regulator
VIRVVLVADVRLHREGVAALLAGDKRLRVTALARPAADLAPWSNPPDVVIVDASADGGTESIRQITSAVRQPIVALGVPDEEQDVIAFAESGVLGFVEREASVEELVASVVSAARGEASFPPRIATTLLRRVSALAAPRRPADAAGLTGRERQIVQLIAQGLSNKEIATRLCIEVATVKNHVHNILEKLQVSRRSDAVARLRVIEGGGSEPAVLRRSTNRSRAG